MSRKVKRYVMKKITMYQVYDTWTKYPISICEEKKDAINLTNAINENEEWYDEEE